MKPSIQRVKSEWNWFALIVLVGLDRAPPKAWRGRGIRAGSTGSILPSREPSRSGRVSC